MANITRLTIFLFGCSIAFGALTIVDDFSRTTLDQLVRKKLMFMVLDQANDTIEMQTRLKHQCEVLINKTLGKCKACAASYQHPAEEEDVWNEVLPVMLLPYEKTGEVVKDIEGSIVDAASVMGDQTEHFVNDVGSVAKNAGHSLIDGTKDIANGAAGGLKDLGNKIAGLAKDIGHGLENTVNLIGDGTLNLGSDIGHSFESLGNSLSNGAQSALDRIKNLGHQIGDIGSSAGHAIEGAVHSIGHALGGIFGKRHVYKFFGKRHAYKRSVCSSCDEIDTKTKDANTILTDVCGDDNVRQQSELTNAITKMKIVYDSAVHKAVITEVEYDADSIDVTSGVAFKTVYVTYQLGGQTTRYKADVWYRLTNLPSTANELAEEIIGR